MSEEVVQGQAPAEVVDSGRDGELDEATGVTQTARPPSKPDPTLLGYFDGDVKLMAAVTGIIKVSEGFKTEDVRAVTGAITKLDPALTRMAPLVFAGVSKAKADDRYRFITLAEFSIREMCQFSQGWEVEGQPDEVLAHAFDAWQRSDLNATAAAKANCNFINLAALVIVERRKSWSAHDALQAAAAALEIPVVGAPKTVSGADYADLVGTRPSITSMKAALRRFAPVLATTEELGSASHEHASNAESLRRELEAAEGEAVRLKESLGLEQSKIRHLEQEVVELRAQVESGERGRAQSVRESRQRTVALLNDALARLAQSKDAIGLGTEGLTAATRDIEFVERRLEEECKWLCSSE